MAASDAVLSNDAEPVEMVALVCAARLAWLGDLQAGDAPATWSWALARVE